MHSDPTSHGSLYGQEVSVNKYRPLSACKANFKVPLLGNGERSRAQIFQCKEIGFRTIANDLENPDPGQVVYTDFQLRKPISRKRLELRSSKFVCKETRHRTI